MREPTLEDILSADELENLGELDERSGWDNDEPVKPEFRRYQDPEISAFTTAVTIWRINLVSPQNVCMKKI